MQFCEHFPFLALISEQNSWATIKDKIIVINNIDNLLKLVTDLLDVSNGNVVDLEVTYEEIDFANAIKSNPSYSYSVKENYISKHFFNKLKRKSVLKLLNKYCSDKFISKVIRKAVYILGGN